jgi:IclR family transcriptional regulator, mhp operon transcriptional activator
MPDGNLAPFSDRGGSISSGRSSGSTASQAVRGHGNEQSRARSRSNAKRGDAAQAENSYRPVEAAQRVLRVLRALNSVRSASIAELHAMTGLSKSTVVRMLETLMFEGYVARDNFLGGYRVTSEAQHLSKGFEGLPLVIEASRPWAVKLTKKIKWPVSIATMDRGKLVVDFTTAAISPWAFPFTTLHRELSLTRTAMGRCYLAFCPPDEREKLLLGLRRGSSGKEFDPAVLNYALETARQNGYAVQDKMRGSQRFQFIGVPLFVGGNCIACVGVGFYSRAPAAGRIESDIYIPARQTADLIEEDIARLQARLGVAAEGA